MIFWLNRWLRLLLQHWKGGESMNGGVVKILGVDDGDGDMHVTNTITKRHTKPKTDRRKWVPSGRVALCLGWMTGVL
jgi:hypothetical protein